MSIIAVTGLPPRINLKDLVKGLAKHIRGQFEALNFAQNKKNEKTAYLRLSNSLNPREVVQKINGVKVKSAHIRAFIPDVVPKMTVALKPKTISKKMQRALNIPPSFSYKELIEYSHEHIMREMQCKYTGLFNLSLNTGHKLLVTIAKTVYDRLDKILEQDRDLQSCYNVTKTYRKRHPHFADFQFILSTLHMLQDAAGEPREQIQESELTAFHYQHAMIDNIPYQKVEATCNKHADRIISKMMDHINKLDLQGGRESLEAAARVKVREQLKKLTPYLPTIVRQMIIYNFMPREASFYIVKVYGEPFLPGKEILQPFTKKHRVMNTRRSDRMYNLISLKVPRDAHMGLLAADGTLVGGAKLVIRPSPMPRLKCTRDYSLDNKVNTEQPPELNVEMLDWTESW